MDQVTYYIDPNQFGGYPKSHDKIKIICSLHGEFLKLLSDFKKGNGCSFCNGQKPNGYWTLERCIEEALKHKTKNEWRKKSGGSFDSALRNGWLDECSKHMFTTRKPDGYWTLKICIEEAKKYKTKKEWQQKSGSSYSIVYKNDWIEQCCKHMIENKKPDGYWTLKRCIIDSKKYKTKKEWQQKSGSSYSSAQKNGWIEQCCKHMFVIRKIWTKKETIEEAKKYKTKKEWRKKSGSSYNKSLRNGWLDKCCKHMINGRIKWTFEKCIEEAKNFKTRSKWAKKSLTSYKVSCDNGWLDECSKHMIKTTNNFWKNR